MNSDRSPQENEGFPAEAYRESWGFLREAEACAAEGRRKAAQSYARAAVLLAVTAAEGFLETVFARVDVMPGIDAKVEDALRKIGNVLTRNQMQSEEWRRLSSVLEALNGLVSLPGWEDRHDSAIPLKNEILKRMLDLAIEHCRENLGDKRLLRAQDRLTVLRAEMGKRTVKMGSLAKRWFEGATGLTSGGSGGGEKSHRDFQQIVLKARGQAVAGGAHAITVEEARLACGAVRSMIASVCGAAGKEVPQWVLQIHDRIDPHKP